MEEASNPQESTNISKSSSGFIGIVGVIIAIVVIGIVILLFKAQKGTNLAPSSYQTPTSQIPTNQQVTEANAPQVLDETGAAIEADMNQLNSDMKTLDQNNASADNPNSL